MKTKHHGQMSESFLTAVFLSLSGGLQDAYTYLFRGKVFANAQTGNIVLLSSNLMDGNWERVLHYLVPLCAFALGVLTAEKMQEHFRNMQRLHWRQLVVLGEVLLLFLVGFLPQEANTFANSKAISAKMIICRQCTFSVYLKWRWLHSAAKIPSRNDSTGMRYRALCRHWPSNR